PVSEAAPAPREEVLSIHLSSTTRSCALCQRSPGFFARQVLTTWSRSVGIPSGPASSGAIGGGSWSNMAAITLAWLLPANAFLPVAISCCLTPYLENTSHLQRSYNIICHLLLIHSLYEVSRLDIRSTRDWCERVVVDRS